MLNQATDLKRNRYVIDDRNHNHIVVDGKSLINFSSNDYLGIASHPFLKKAFIQGVQQYGVGSSSSALVSGYYRSHHLLEDKFAEFLNRDQAILFNSGYLANIGVITSLVRRNDKILADKLCHASLLDGMRLSKAKCQRYLHNDIQHLDALMSKQEKIKLTITESIFSMEGDISPIDQIAKITTWHQSLLMVDDAHGTGVLGRHGRGICEYYELSQKDVAYLIVPLGKAFASMGAVVSGSHDLIEELIQFSRTYRYTTALPPAIAKATLASLSIIEKETWRRHKLVSLIEFFIKQAKQHSLNFISNDLSPIKSILIGSNEIAMKIKDELMQKGFFISCIRPPTVPQGTTRLRISLTCMHDEHEITHLLDLITACYDRCK